jgi:autotransporter-associated beta strand protein
MKTKSFISLATLCVAGFAPALYAQTTTSWNSTSSGTWSTAANWTAGAPSTGPQIADYPGTATLQHTFDLAGATGRTMYGNQFDFVAGGVGYTFNGTAGTVSGLFIRAGGPINGGAGGIVNNDDSTQTFNVPVKLTSNSGIAGSLAAQTFNAAAGSMVFNGNNNAPATPWTINLNGASALTFDGSFNNTVGSSGPGQIVNTNIGTLSGLTKNGSGTLTLGGTAANTFVGVNRLNAGMIVAAKADALGAGNALVASGGTFNTGGLNQNFGTLDLEGVVTMSLSGAGTVSFANSSAVSWGASGLLDFEGFTGGTQVRFGTDPTGLTSGQLGKIEINGVAGEAGLDPSGYLSIVVVPEPSTIACFGLGIVALFISRRRKV